MNNIRPNNSINTDHLILGAGIAGLAASKKCNEHGIENLILEKSSSAGGLLAGFDIQGFKFDQAVHLSFATEPEVRKVFDLTPYHTHQADPWNIENGTWIKHPVQYNLHPLEIEDKIDLIQSFINRPNIKNPKIYNDWLLTNFGEKLANRFPGKYARKYWDKDPTLLSTTWIKERVKPITLDNILRGAMSDVTSHNYYVKEMRYPINGGYKSFIDPLIKQAKIFYNSNVMSIDLDKKEVTVQQTKYSYKKLISSIPLPILIEKINSKPNVVYESSKKLECTSIDLISIGIKKSSFNKLWFYLYDIENPFSRVHMPSVKSNLNAPDNYVSFQFEAYTNQRESKFSPNFLKERALDFIIKNKISAIEDVIFVDHRRVPWGNVTFYKGMECDRKIIINFLKKNNISVCGRFGEWDYLWSNQSFMSGYNAIKPPK